MLVNTVNEPGAAGAQATVDTTEIGKVTAAWAFLWTGELQPLPFKQHGHSVTFDVPMCMQATVVLVNRCEPWPDPAAPDMLADGERVTARVDVLNLNATPLSGTVRWVLPAGWSATSAACKDIPSGGTVTVHTDIRPPPRSRPYDLYCVAEAKGSVGRRYCSLSVVPSPYVDFSFQPNARLRVTLHNYREQAVNAQVKISLPPDCPATVTPATTLGVPAGGDADTTFTFGKLEAMDRPAAMHIDVTCTGQSQSVPVRLFPLLCNGSFELDLAGDGKPEYWTTYDYSGKLEQSAIYPLIHLDTRWAYDGKTSLRIDPYTQEPGHHVDVFPLSTMLSPGTSYHVTAYARVPAGGKLTITGPMYQPLAPIGAPDANGWQQYEKTVTTGPDVVRDGLFITNAGATPVWVDAIKVEMVK